METAAQPIIGAEGIHWYYTGVRDTHSLDLKARYKAISRLTWCLGCFAPLNTNQAEGVGEIGPLRISEPLGQCR